jgi:hypothetical protein
MAMAVKEEAGAMRRSLSVAVAFLCAVVLSSCALLPFGHGGGVFDDSLQQADARMEQIGAALNAHDAAALKAMYSTRALEQAPDLDARLDSLLSTFPNGGVTWKLESGGSGGTNEYGQKTVTLSASYKVFADGKEYSLFFVDFTRNDAIDPDNVGLYALGVIPWADDLYSVPTDAFIYWLSSIKYDESNEEGYPGVYAEYDNSHLSLLRLPGILEELNSGDSVGLADRFTEYARTQYLTEPDEGVTALFALFPKMDVVAEDQQDPPVVREKTDPDQEQLLLVSTYQVSASGGDYWLVCADFRKNTVDPRNLGIYAIGAAHRTASGDSAAEQALFAWADTFDVDGSVPPGIFISK